MSSSIARQIVQSFQRFSGNTAAEADNLSPREREVLELVARGYLYKEIAESLPYGQIMHPLHFSGNSALVLKRLRS